MTADEKAKDLKSGMGMMPCGYVLVNGSGRFRLEH